MPKARNKLRYSTFRTEYCLGETEMAYGAGGAAAAAAAAKRRRQMLAEEEEDMIQYTPDDLNNDWEFKIVRS